MLVGKRLTAVVLATSLVSSVAVIGATVSRSTRGSSSATAAGGAATGPTGTTAAVAAPAAPCPDPVAGALLGVAQRIYARAATGPNARASRARVEGSTALADAVARGDAQAANAALQPLLRAQIQRIQIIRGGRTLASAGTTTAVAPISGVIRGPGGAAVGRYVMSVGSAGGLTGAMGGVTGADVALVAGNRVVAGDPQVAAARGARTGQIGTIPATAFPSGRATFVLRFSGAGCAPNASAAAVAAVDGVAHRLAAEEISGTMVHGVLAHVASDPGFQAAVAHRDPVALRAAIIRFFQDPSLHVVRIRAVTPSGKLIGDVGGPYVLGPATQAVTSPSGQLLGRVTLSIQDDAGYVKLLSGFTGAQVVLRTRQGIVPSSTLPGAPSALPTSGTVMVGGRRYAVRSFTATAFPNGPLWVSALLPA